MGVENPAESNPTYTPAMARVKTTPAHVAGQRARCDPAACTVMAAAARPVAITGRYHSGENWATSVSYSNTRTCQPPITAAPAAPPTRVSPTPLRAVAMSATPVPSAIVPTTAARCGGLHSTASRPKAPCHHSSTGADASVNIAPVTASPTGPEATARSPRRCHAHQMTTATTTATPA